MFSPNTSGQQSRSFGNWMAILFYRRNPDDTFQDPVAIDRAFFSRGEKDATPTGGVRVKQSRRVWKLVPSDVGDPEPKADDVIQEKVSGIRWEIDTVNTDEYDQFHTCETTQEDS